MKTRHIIGTAIAIGMAFLASCERHGSVDTEISQLAKDSFNEMFPGATQVEWRLSGEYAVASFYLAESRSAERNREAWFHNGNGKWNMTDTDITFDELPQPVKDAFAASQYAGWTVEDVEKLERDGTEVLYNIDAEGSIDGIPAEVDLTYTPDGVLVRERIDTDKDNGEFIPDTPDEAIMEYIKTNYPDARIIDIDVEDDGTEVKIIDNGIVYELFFDITGNWAYTKRDIRYDELPEQVRAAFEASEYANQYRIDDIEHFTTADKGEFYRFELEDRRDDITIDITPDGTITAVEEGDGHDDGHGDRPHDDGNLPESIISFIESRYPGAEIVGTDCDRGYIEVEIRHEDKEKDVRFNGREEWVRTDWDVTISEVPAAATEAVKAAFPDYEIDDEAEFTESTQGEWYCIEIERRGDERRVRVTAEGELL